MHYDDGEGLASISPLEIEEITAALKRNLRARGLDAHTSEDVVQETWLVALRKQPRERARGWLFGATSRIVHSMRRANRNRRDRELDAARREPVEPGEDAALGATLMRWVEELPSPYREVLELHFAGGLETSEIAASLGRPEATVRSQLKRGLDRLRARAGDRPRAAWSSVVLVLERLAARARRVGLGTHRDAAWWLAGAAISLAVVLGAITWPRDGGVAPVVVEASARARSSAAELPERALEARFEAAVRERSPAMRRSSVTRSLTGVVRDPGGLPVAGAAVHVGGAEGSAARATVVTDAEGRFTLESVPPDALVWASASRWFDSRRRFVATHADDAPCDLRLGGSGDVVRVRVVSPDGELIAGARVELADPRVDARTPILVADAIELPSPSMSRTTGSDGCVELGLPDLDEVSVRVEASGRVPWSALFATAEIGRTLDVRMPLAVVLFGVVVDAAGERASNASVELVQLDGAHRRSTRSTIDGTYRFDDAAPGRYLLIASEDPALGTDSCRGEGVLAEGSSAALVLELSPASTLLGRALGAPAGSTVRLRVAGRPDVSWQERTLVLGKDERFAFPGCATDRTHRIDVFAGDGRALATLARRKCGREVHELDARGPSGEALELEVEFERVAGAPLPTLVELRSSDPPRSIVAHVDPATGRAAFPRVTLAAATHAELRGGFLLVAWIPGAGPCRVRTLDRSVSGKVLERVRLPAAGRLSIVLALDGGADARDVRGSIAGPGFNVHGFRIRTAQRLRREIAPDEHGRIELELPPGSYDVALRVDGGNEVVEKIEIEPARTRTHTFANDPSRDVGIAIDVERALEPMETYAIVARTPRGAVRLAGRAQRWIDRRLELRAAIPSDTLELVFTTSEGLRSTVEVPATDAGTVSRYTMRAVESE